MTDNTKQIKELIRNNPNLSGNKIYELSKQKGIGIRKTDFYKLVREVRQLPPPTKAKREKSIPKRYRTVISQPLPIKLPKIPFEYTKFGKIVRDLQKRHNISERKAIIHARKILKIPKSDYEKINQIDKEILEVNTP